MSEVPALHVLNGSNLNPLGEREPHIYGTTTLTEVEEMCRAAAHGPLMFAQTNHEGVMIEQIHAARGVAGGLSVQGYPVAVGAMYGLMK